ncbi:hypothetical protein [Streptomyces sp. S1D4-20]|uniref:hypothetical protein n=1 Tax=Streptomyces sp. S1D4-20 TaxID=2594462 RepID=UPI001F073E1A|nr:hypothetical protein [Streptomyces sp. S1D4-20]
MTLFRQLVEEKGWTTPETFNLHFTKAGRELAEETGEKRFADVTVARRSFDRWMAGSLKRFPQSDTRSVLEHLFKVSPARLFAEIPAAVRMTLFRQLVEEKGWTAPETFNLHFTKAGRELAEETGEERFADVTVARRSFDRWMAGSLKRFPQSDTRSVLKHLFKVSPARLFAEIPAPPAGEVAAPDSDNLGIKTAPLQSEEGGAGTLLSEPLLQREEGAAVDRRRFLLTGSVSALPLLPDALGSSRAGPPRPDRMDSELIDPVLRHLREMWHMLVRSDNLLGPRHTLQGVHQQLAVLEGLLDSTVPPLRNEVLHLASRYAESAAWLHEDCADQVRASHWTRQAMEWAVEAGDDTMTAWTLFRRAQQATSAGKGAETISLSRAVQRYDHALTPQMRAAALQQEAHGYALMGDEITCHGLIDQAVALAATPEDAGDGRNGHGDFATPAYLEGQRAHCWMLLKRPERAAPILSASLTELPEVYQRDRGLAHARLAASYALTGEIDQAVTQAHSALAVARLAGSTRTLHETIAAVDALRPARDNRGVAELIEAVTAS